MQLRDEHLKHHQMRGCSLDATSRRPDAASGWPKSGVPSPCLSFLRLQHPIRTITKATITNYPVVLVRNGMPHLPLLAYPIYRSVRGTPGKQPDLFVMQTVTCYINKVQRYFPLPPTGQTKVGTRTVNNSLNHGCTSSKIKSIRNRVFRKCYDRKIIYFKYCGPDFQITLITDYYSQEIWFRDCNEND